MTLKLPSEASSMFSIGPLQNLALDSNFPSKPFILLLTVFFMNKVFNPENFVLKKV